MACFWILIQFVTLFGMKNLAKDILEAKRSYKVAETDEDDRPGDVEHSKTMAKKTIEEFSHSEEKSSDEKQRFIVDNRNAVREDTHQNQHSVEETIHHNQTCNSRKRKPEMEDRNSITNEENNDSIDNQVDGTSSSLSKFKKGTSLLKPKKSKKIDKVNELDETEEAEEEAKAEIDCNEKSSLLSAESKK